MIPSFDWLPLTWDAVAVFVTGLAAVGGATVVGRKQAAIAKQQAEIQKFQAENDRKLRANTLKLELLEQRSEIIGKLRRVYLAFNANVELTSDDRRTLGEAIQSAELIFQADLIKGLRDISLKTGKLGFINRRADQAYRRGNSEKGDEYNEEASQLEAEVFTQLPDLINSMIEHSRLHDVT